MAFNTYKCEKFIIYLQDSKTVFNDIYKLIESSPFTTTKLGEVLGLNYFAIARKIKLRNLTNKELIQVLNFIK